MNNYSRKKSKHTEVFESFNLVVFGGDGDLALRKIYPALFHRQIDGQLLCEYNVIATQEKIQLIQLSTPI